MVSGQRAPMLACLFHLFWYLLCSQCCSYGTKSVLHDISFSISSGTITGLLGPSGAGKTTLVNLLTGQLKPDKGVITQAVPSPATGVMMDDLGLYERLTVWDNLALFAELYRVSRKRIEPLLIRTGLIHAKKQTVSSLSKGMRNRVNFCRALLKDVQILYLDEPTSGLDPATTEKIHELILEERKKGYCCFSDYAQYVCRPCCKTDTGRTDHKYPLFGTHFGTGIFTSHRKESAMNPIFIILKKQFKDTFKNKSILIQFVMFPLLAVIMTNAISLKNMPANFFGTLFASMYVGMAPLTGISAIISEEKEKHTLRVLLMAGVSPVQYLLGTGCYVFLACMPGSILFSCLLTGVTFASRLFFLLILSTGILVSIVVGATIGIQCKNQMTAASVTVPVMMVFFFYRCFPCSMIRSQKLHVSPTPSRSGF